MIESISKYLLYGKTYCGIEHTSMEGRNAIFISILKKSKKEIVFKEKLKVDSIDKVAEKIPKNQHVSLIINDNRVLSKSVESSQTDNLKLFYTAYPNINPEEFYFEIVSNNDKHFISACRKEHVDGIIKDYSGKKIFVTGFSLGNSVIVNIVPFIEQDYIKTSNAVIEINDGKIKKVENAYNPDRNVYDINGEYMSGEYLLSYSSGLNKILDFSNNHSNYQQRLFDLKDDYKQNCFFQQFLRFAGLFILGLLLINFFVFNHYFNEVNELRQVSQINQSNKEQIVGLNEEVSKKQKLVEDLMKSGSSKSSYYLNEIVTTMPPSIILSEFNYQPLEKRVKADKPIEIDGDVILVTGSSNQSELFSFWIEKIEGMNWTKSLDILEYGYESRRSSEFKFKITLADD